MNDMLSSALADNVYTSQRWYAGGSQMGDEWHIRTVRHSGRVAALREALGQIQALR